MPATLEQLRRPRTPEEARAALQRFINGKGRLCVPVQADDDNLVLNDVIDEWERLRAGGRELLPEVAAFALAMDEKIRAHDKDRGEYGWRRATPVELFRWLDRYRGALYELVCWAPFRATPEHIRGKAANVANLAMMIADVCGAFREPPSPDEVEPARGDVVETIVPEARRG